MNHTIRIKRHFIRDVLAYVAGGALVAAILGRSWLSLALSVINTGALFVEERADIQEEEEE
jgi:hypothetical protein